MREGLATVVRVALVCVLLGATAAADPLTDALATDDPHALEVAVAAIEHAPGPADALFAAARACEETLHDPARALALYDRLARELPDARVTVAARRRGEILRARLGGHGEYAREGEELARLIADVDRLPADEVERRATASAAAAWPGAPEAALWLAEWLQRSGRFTEASERYADVVARWPGTASARAALRGAAGCAIDAHDWSGAERLAAQLPTAAPGDLLLRDDVLASAARGRWHDRWYRRAWWLVAAVLAALIASLVEALARGGWRRPRLRPSSEIVFIAPVAAVLIAFSFTANRLIAPAVTTISLGGLALAWLSGVTLDTLHARGRPVRRRAVAHVGLCFVAVVALGCIAVMRGGLLDLLLETVRFGPE